MAEKLHKKKALQMRCLRQRWIMNSVLPVALFLATVAGIVSLGISNYYYSGMRDGLTRQAKAQSGAFIDYFMNEGFTDYLKKANQAISDYEDKDRVEMQFVSGAGRILASSTSTLWSA